MPLLAPVAVFHALVAAVLPAFPSSDSVSYIEFGHMSNALRSNRRQTVSRDLAWLPLVFILVLCVVVLVVLRLRAGDPVGIRIDSWSEANILVSARNVAIHGWQKYGGAAQHQVDRPPFQSDPFYYYAHYPLGASYVTWSMYSLGVTDLSTVRWVPALGAIATLLLWWALLRRFVPPATAVVSTTVLATAFGFLAYADDLHHGYSLALLLGMIVSYVTGLAHDGRRRHVLLLVAWALLLVNSFMSWEWYLWSQMFFWAHAVLVGVPFRRRWLLLFALAPLLAFGVQYGLRLAALGNDSGAGTLDDVLRRTIRFAETGDTPPGLALSTYPLLILQRFREFYGIHLGLLLGLLTVWAVLVGGLRRTAFKPTPALRWMVVFFVCSLTWWSVMLQHTAVHPHVMRHALFFYALALGVVIADGARVVIGRQSKWWIRAAVAASLACVVWPHIQWTGLNLRMHRDRSYLLPGGWSAGWSEGDFFKDMAAKLPAEAIVLTNFNRLPLMRYWIDRPAYSASLVTYPYHHDHTPPNARYQVELTTSHLRQLYGERLPRLVYVYVFYGQAGVAYAGDPVLRLLVDGVWGEDSPVHGAGRLREVLSGRTPIGAYPVLATGPRWVAFDAARLPEAVRRAFPTLAPPTRAEFGPPR